jgi:hypothetical protein
MSQARFIGEGFAPFNENMEVIDETLSRVINDGIHNRYGENGIPNPSDVEISPVLIDEPTFVVRAWHETGGVASRGRLQAHDFSFTLTLGKEDMFLKTEDKRQYRLTTREALFFMQVGGLAALKTLIATSGSDEF